MHILLVHKTFLQVFPILSHWVQHQLLVQVPTGVVIA